MSLVSNPLTTEEIKLKERQDTQFKSVYANDPASKINNNMLNFTLNFEPLKEILNSVIDSQKMTKNRIDELVSENVHMKNTLAEYEEKFVYIETKIGKVIGKNNVCKLKLYRKV